MPTLYPKYTTITDCDVSLPGGILRVIWYSELDNTALPIANVPKLKDYLIDPGEFLERLDDYSSILAPGYASLMIKDEYLHYTNGVFHKMFTGGVTNILCALSEDGGSTWGFLFEGTLDKKQTNFDERFVVSGKYIRGISAGIITTMSQLESGVSGVVSDILARIETGSRTRIDGTDKYAYPCPLIDIFRSCMYAAFGSSSIDYSSCVTIPPGRNDIDYQADIASFLNIDNIYFLTSWYEDPDLTTSKYFDSSNDLAWVNTFGTIRQMLCHFAKSLGYMFRIFYGDSSGLIDFATMSNNRYHMALLNRGKQNDGSTLVTVAGTLKTSGFSLDSDLAVKRFLAFPRNGGFAVPSNDPLIQIPCDFWHVGDPPSDISASLYFVDSEAPYYLFQIIGVQYYDYLNKARASYIGNSTVVVQRFYERRYTKGTRIYDRTYRGLKATESSVTSQRIMQPSVRSQIADGSGTDRTYFASETGKSPLTNELRAKWIEE